MYRFAEHAQAILAVTARLKKIAPVPVWLVGTSRGPIAVANAAARTEFLSFEGGAPARAALSAHGFPGIEERVVTAIVEWLRRSGAQR